MPSYQIDEFGISGEIQVLNSPWVMSMYILTKCGVLHNGGDRISGQNISVFDQICAVKWAKK